MVVTGAPCEWAIDFKEKKMKHDNYRRQLLIASSLSLGPLSGRLLAQENTITLGQTADFSATRASLSVPYTEGAKLFFNEFNAKGGLFGKKIELVSLDDGYQINKAIENCKKLIDQNVFALINSVGTGITDNLIPIVEKAKVPFLNPITGADHLRAPEIFSRYVFHLRGSYGDEIESIVRHLFTIGLNKIGLVYENEAFGNSIKQLVDRSLSKRKSALHCSGIIPFNNATAVEDAAKNIAARVPDALILGNIGPSAINFIKALSLKGIKTQYFTISVANANRLYTELKEGSRGIVVSQVMPNPGKSSMPVVREYRALIAKNSPQTQPSYLGLEGYMSAKIFSLGLLKAGKNASREKFIEGMESLSRFDMGGFPVHYSRQTHNGSNFVELTMIGNDGRLIA
jgi:branched-chain amino acid transport system substrate-binding protein